MKDFDEDDELEKPYDAKLMRRFLGYLRPHRRVVAATLAVMFVSIGVQLAGPFILRAAIDGPIADGDAEGLWFYGGLFMGFALLGGLLEAAQNYISNLAGQRIIFDIRTETFAHLSLASRMVGCHGEFGNRESSTAEGFSDSIRYTLRGMHWGD